VARSLLSKFVSGTRQLLAAQLFVGVAAVALAGWSLGITNDLIRDRNRLRDRVIQLEETLAGRGITVPPHPTIVDVTGPADNSAYPPSAQLAESNVVAYAPGAEAPARAFNPGQALGDLFAPAPPIRTIVLHARGDADAAIARHIAGELEQTQPARIVVNVLAPRDPHASGYSYFDGRQSRAAVSLVARFNDLARGINAAPWSAQLRGTALPANAEFGADRLDIVLPALPEQETGADPENGIRILE
jgi:hypothetical protein